MGLLHWPSISNVLLASGRQQRAKRLLQDGFDESKTRIGDEEKRKWFRFHYKQDGYCRAGPQGLE